MAKEHYSSNNVTIKQLKSIIQKLHAAGSLGNISIYVTGPPGIGKTALFEQVAKDLNADHKVFLTCTMDPTDVAGVPWGDPKNQITEFLPPKRLLCLTDRYPDKSQFTIASFEDLPACPEQIFASLFRLFHERTVGDYGDKIRRNVLMCATGNRVSDRAGAQELPSALANRFVHYNLQVSTEEWVSWALRSDIDPMIIAFVSQGGGSRYLHEEGAASENSVFATPRAVARASKLVKALERDADLLFSSLAGCCGDAWAAAFTTFNRLKSKVIPVEEIFQDWSKASIPKEKDIDLTFVLITNLLCAVLESKDPEKAASALQYGARLHARDMGAKLTVQMVHAMQDSKEHVHMMSEKSVINAIHACQEFYGKIMAGI